MLQSIDNKTAPGATWTILRAIERLLSVKVLGVILQTFDRYMTVDRISQLSNDPVSFSQDQRIAQTYRGTAGLGGLCSTGSSTLLSLLLFQSFLLKLLECALGQRLAILATLDKVCNQSTNGVVVRMA